MNYSECENYISEIPKFVSDLGKTSELTAKILDGKCKSKIIHVAGTNGKGSVCTFIESILFEAGLTVGKFVSPHLVTMRERINFNKEMISENDFVDAFQTVKALSKEMDYTPNYFEYTLLIALVYYMKKSPDYIILETGLGGKLDQTNFVTIDKLDVITEIGMDHMAYLGDTFEKIAAEKAGIIMKQNKVVFFDKRKETSSVILDRINEVEAYGTMVSASNIKNIVTDINSGKITFDYENADGRHISLEISSLAKYQCENAALAVETIYQLADSRINDEHIKTGIKSMRWPGRMELLNSGVYIDGAHNVDGIDAFLDTVKETFGNRKCHLLFSVVFDKEYSKMVEKIVNSNLFEKIIVAQLDSDRAASLDRLLAVFEECGCRNVVLAKDVKAGYEILLESKTLEDISLFSVGSLYLVGQIKEIENNFQSPIDKVGQ